MPPPGDREGSSYLRLNPPAHSFFPGNRNALPRDFKVVDRHSVYPRAQLQPILDRFEAYLDQHALSPATVRNYLADLRAFARWHTARMRSSYSAFEHGHGRSTDHCGIPVRAA